MSFIGNVFFGLAALILFYLVTTFYSKPMPGGDAGVGYAWGVIILNLGFVICMGIVALIIGSKGGFEWVAATKSSRTLYVTVSVLSVLIFVGLAGLFQGESKNFAGPARFLLPLAYLWLPVIMMLISFILLNDSIRSSVPVALYKYPAIIISAIGVLGLGSLMFVYFASSVKNQAAMVRNKSEFEDQNHNRILQEIDTCNAMTSIGNILVFSGDNQPKKIQSAAVSKIKTNPEWEQVLIEYLNSANAPEVFQFLASNEVDHPALFLEPIQKGLLVQADQIRERIRRCSHPSHFYESMFAWEIERVIRTVDKYKGKGVDYLPAMKEARAALDEPSDFKQITLRVNGVMDKWIKANSK